FRSVRSGTILDTGPIVAYLYRRDAHHDWAVDAFGDLDAPVITCEPVLTEACFLIERNRWPATRVLEYALERNAHRPPRGNRNGGSMRADAALCERADVAGGRLPGPFGRNDRSADLYARPRFRNLPHEPAPA